MRVYFFLRPQGPPESSNYQHCAVALGEGLRALGVPFCANVDYWREKDGFLFRRDPAVVPEDCSIIITGDEYGQESPVPGHLFGGGRRTVHIDSSDGWRTRAEAPAYRRFDLVLRTHSNAHYRYPSNVRPWAFGLTERILSHSSGGLPFQERARALLWPFRVSHPVRSRASGVRSDLSGRFPADDSVDAAPGPELLEEHALWAATGRRHYPAFFSRLRQTMLCAAFGGYFAPGILGRTESLGERTLYAVCSRLRVATRTVMQFDSWRFWESLASGCLTLQLDYHRYGCLLPEMPVSRTHYAGIDLAERDPSAWILDSSDEELASVACTGRDWAVEHYAPAPTARRLLRLLGERV